MKIMVSLQIKESIEPHTVIICIFLQDSACAKTAIELRQSVSLIYDTLTVGSGSRDWSFRKLFGTGLSGSCPLASGSRIYVDISQNKVRVYHLFT